MGEDGERVMEGRGGKEEFKDERMGVGVVRPDDLGMNLFELSEGGRRREGFENGFGGCRRCEVRGRKRDDGLWKS